MEPIFGKVFKKVTFNPNNSIFLYQKILRLMAESHVLNLWQNSRFF